MTSTTNFETTSSAPGIPPEQQHPARIEGAPDVLQIESLDRFVGAYADLRAAAAGNRDLYNQGEARLAQMIKDQLAASGITHDADNPENNQEYEYAAGLLVHIATMDKNDWMDGEGTGYRNRLFRELLERYDPIVVPPSDTSESGTDDEVDDPPEEDTERTADVIRAELDEARDAWSSMQAKRQGRMWDRRIEGYNAAKERYETLLRELGSRTLEGTITDDNLSDAEKNAAVLAYIFDEQNNLRAKTKEKVKNTRVSRFIEKFGGWLSRGNGWVRFGKGAAVGLGAGLIGAGVGLLAGAAGIGAAVAGASAIVVKGAANFTKSYARADAIADRGMNEMDAAVLTGWRNGINDQEGDDIITKAAALSNKQFEDDTRKEQGKRRKTTATAMGGMAVGAALGVGGGLLLDHLGVSDFVHDRIKIWGGDHDVDGSNGGSGGGSGGGGAETTEDVDWTTPALPNESFYVDYGHGYTHELVDLATANGQQLSGNDAWDLHLHLVDKFGPDYINIANSGGSDIYFDNGDVRLSTPGTASWENGVTEEVHNWMVLRGVWR